VSLSATTGLFDRVTAELRNLDSLLAEATKWEEQMAVPAGGGRAQGILARADAFTVERQYRRRAEASAQSLARLLQQALALSARMAAVNAARLDQLQAVLTSVPAARQAAVDAPRQPDLSDFEYYEVKTITDLKRISALPEVYGDASRWEALYEANRDKIADPAAPLPTGTLLVVPVRSPESTGER
jgi:hypothetical protein